MATTDPVWLQDGSERAEFEAREIGGNEPLPAIAVLVRYMPDAAATPAVRFGGFPTLAAAQAAVAELQAGLGPHLRAGRFVLVDARTGATLAVRATG
jgi:hypothetical protein